MLRPQNEQCVRLAGPIVLAALTVAALLAGYWRVPIAHADSLGTQWTESELGWSGTWVRRGSSNTFDATWTAGSSRVTAVLTMTLNGNNVSIGRQDTSSTLTCNYTGTISGTSVSGTYTCANGVGAGGPFTWSATIAGATPSSANPPSPAPQPGGQSAQAWAGCWATDWGNMWFNLSGASASGPYGYPGRAPNPTGQFSGTVSGGTLIANWVDQRGSGVLTATLAANGRAWTGSYTGAPPNTSAAWSGNFHPEVTTQQACVPNSSLAAPSGPAPTPPTTISALTPAPSTPSSQPQLTPPPSSNPASSPPAVSNGTAGGPPAGATSLGGLDLASYCRSGGASVVLGNDGIWYCQAGTDFFIVIQMDSACQWQYNSPAAFARQRTAGDPQTWTCYVSGGGSGPGSSGGALSPGPSASPSPSVNPSPAPGNATPIPPESGWPDPNKH